MSDRRVLQRVVDTTVHSSDYMGTGLGQRGVDSIGLCHLAALHIRLK